MFLRLTATWSGAAIGQGVTTLAVGSGSSWTQAQVDSARSSLNTFFSGVQGYLPDDVTIQIPSSQMLVDELDGELVGEFTGGSPISARVGTGATEFANGVGASIQWNTDQFAAGRRVRGRTFLVPLVTGIFDVDGTLDAAFVTALTSAASGLRTNLSGVNGGLQVWSRPRAATEALPARTGALFPVVSATVKDKASWLRTRRD